LLDGGVLVVVVVVDGDGGGDCGAGWLGASVRGVSAMISIPFGLP
jgi:hypothetical protein